MTDNEAKRYLYLSYIKPRDIKGLKEIITGNIQLPFELKPKFIRHIKGVIWETESILPA